MKLTDLIHAPTRLSWTLRLLLYIAVFVTASLVVQIVQVILW